MGCDTGPRRGPVKEKKRKEKSHNFGQNAPAQNDLICSKNGQNCTHTHTHTHTYTYTRVRIKRNVAYTTPEGGGKGAGKPKADRAIRKENNVA